MTDMLPREVLMALGELENPKALPTAERYQLELAQSLDEVRNIANSLADIVRSEPRNDEAINHVSNLLMQAVGAAGRAMNRYSAARDCAGEA